jgi:hypothetical protein
MRLRTVAKGSSIARTGEARGSIPLVHQVLSPAVIILFSIVAFTAVRTTETFRRGRRGAVAAMREAPSTIEPLSRLKHEPFDDSLTPSSRQWAQFVEIAGTELIRRPRLADQFAHDWRPHSSES